MRVTGSVVVDRPRPEVFALLLDPVVLSSADTRITDLEVLTRNETEMRLKARAYIVSPILESTALLRVRLHSCDSIVVESERGTISFPARLVLSGVRTECRLEDTGASFPGRTKVTRAETYVTNDSLLGRLLERRAEGWLTRHLHENVLPRLKQLLELRPPQPDAPA
ncbi:MAG: hypothetical protein U1B78_02750 [Dehalococcoidia bacterium]|nr:hypothetical protein [Dehalococcoidia bacterium]